MALCSTRTESSPFFSCMPGILKNRDCPNTSKGGLHPPSQFVLIPYLCKACKHHVKKISCCILGALLVVYTSVGLEHVFATSHIVRGRKLRVSNRRLEMIFIFQGLKPSPD